MSDPIDPIRANDVQGLASASEVILVFERMVFARRVKIHEKGKPPEYIFDPSKEISAIVALPWEAVDGLLNCLTQLVQQKAAHEPQLPQVKN